MGRRDDNFLDDERSDQVLKRLIEGDTDTRAAALPPELVARTLRRLPAGPPVVAHQRLEQRKRRRVAAVLAVLLPIVLIAAMNVWSVAGEGPQMAFLFGDGHGGISAFLLRLQLAGKPLWNTLRMVDPALLFGGALAAVVSIVLLRQLVRRTHEQFDVESL